MANENEGIQLHDLRPAPGSTKKRKRVGRGNAGRGGTYAGRGRKGQNARAGSGKAPYFEGGQLPLVRRLPRKRGFTNIFRIPFRIVNVERLDTIFEPEDEINPDTLLSRGLIKKGKNPVKVLGEGDLTKALTIHAHAFSKGARQKIEAAGGQAIELEYTEGELPDGELADDGESDE
jgi:large subunit ribosomal protein L15